MVYELNLLHGFMGLITASEQPRTQDSLTYEQSCCTFMTSFFALACKSFKSIQVNKPTINVRGEKFSPALRSMSINPLSYIFLCHRCIIFLSHVPPYQLTLLPYWAGRLGPFGPAWPALADDDDDDDGGGDDQSRLQQTAHYPTHAPSRRCRSKNEIRISKQTQK